MEALTLAVNVRLALLRLEVSVPLGNKSFEAELSYVMSLVEQLEDELVKKETGK